MFFRGGIYIICLYKRTLYLYNKKRSTWVEADLFERGKPTYSFTKGNVWILPLRSTLSQ